MKKTITRTQLVAAIEAGIQRAPGLATAEKIALRSVAAVTDQVAVRAFLLGDCGCPLTQIGCNRDDPESGWSDTQSDTYGRFFTTFDTAVLNTLGIDTARATGVRVRIVEG